jgi:hypothetical protein
MAGLRQVKTAPVQPPLAAPQRDGRVAQPTGPARAGRLAWRFGYPATLMPRLRISPPQRWFSDLIRASKVVLSWARISLSVAS